MLSVNRRLALLLSIATVLIIALLFFLPDAEGADHTVSSDKFLRHDLPAAALATTLLELDVPVECKLVCAPDECGTLVKAVWGKAPITTMEMLVFR